MNWAFDWISLKFVGIFCEAFDVRLEMTRGNRDWPIVRRRMGISNFWTREDGRRFPLLRNDR